MEITSLASKLLYGCGLRVHECLSLRVKERRTLLPEKIVPLLHEQVEQVKLLHKKDVRDGYGEASTSRARSFNPEGG